MSASGRLYFAACELVDNGYSISKSIEILVRDYGISESYARQLIDSVSELDRSI